jgi:16S rRNA (uracil1498-N3)-methyltransferase
MLALIKFDRFEWAVEKATELGVTRIVPVEATRSERGLFEGSRGRLERWRRIGREASEQSRRLRAPEFGNPIKMAAALNEPATHRIWLDERPGAPLLLKAVEPAAGDSVQLIVGPEGGWTDAERTAFCEAGWTGASLGPTVLRAETAVCASLAIIAQVMATI